VLQLAKTSWRKHLALFAIGAAAGLSAVPAAAQIQTVDPSVVIDGDLQQGTTATPSEVNRYGQGTASGTQELPPTTQPAIPASSSATTQGATYPDPYQSDVAPAADPAANPAAGAAGTVEPTVASDTTYKEDDLIGAAEGLFGKGAEGLARLIESILKDQGEPNAYIVGREGGGALVIGVRYGSGTLHHKIEGNMPIYWTGPSIGFDAGANASNTFVLVYNVLDTEELYERFPAGEGTAYFVGGFNASYLRKGDIVLIPIRVGAGLRLGVNAGYMKFSHKQNWLPF